MQEKYIFETKWSDIHVRHREGYYTSITDYHKHDFYEINLILSGNVKILLSDRSVDGSGNKLVLSPPNTLHYITCTPDILYSRIYLLFTEEFIANYLSEWRQLSSVFGDQGEIIDLTTEQTSFFKELILEIEKEINPFRQKLLTYYMLSHIFELQPLNSARSDKIPHYIFEAISYIESHYGEKLLAADIAKSLHIGRTTLMTEFKKHTGNTIGECISECRLKNAEMKLRSGNTLETTAIECGFSDSSGLIHAFKRRYGMTPKQYINTV
ncbi:MAG: AraC family transcriptional regulator [Ruminococcaceae bacterium]|nr:AraC family transcriptional regulator [Oscillospiraceae bacterium]